MANSTTSAFSENAIGARQIAFFAAFILPVYKFVETPSLLAGFMQGDLLVPALLQYLLQIGVLIALLYASSKSEETLLLRLEKRLGGWVRVLFVFLALFYLLSAVLPLLDLEKFVYAVFYDTSPTLFSFAFFFLFSAFIAVKGVKSLGRLADLSLFFFLLPFFALIAMSLVEADFTNLLPLFEKKFGHTVSALTYTKPHFSDVLFLLPLILNLRYKKGDGAKIVTGYSVGAVLSILFLLVFYGLYSSISPREHYAFAKIAQYFPVLSIVGRIDLVFVYMLCVTLFFYTATPLFYSVHFLSKSIRTHGKTWVSALVHFGAFLFVLFCNKYYNSVYALFGNYLFILFFLFDGLIVLLLLLPKEKRYA